MKRFNIVEKRKIFLIISIAIIAVGIIGFFVRGLNLGIDFIGGTTQHYYLRKELTNEDISKVNDIILDITGEKASSIQITGNARAEVIIKTKELESESRDLVFERLSAEFGIDSNDIYMVDNVSPSVGKDLSRSAIMAVLAAVVLMLIYISIRFSFKSGLSTILCLVQDTLIVFTCYVVFNIPINTTFIAAILTILGYSINATIVLFGRVRENRRLMSKDSFDVVVNTSIWQTMNRSVLTSLTTFIMVVMLMFVGVDSIKDFALPISLGIIAGTYSSIFMSGNIWYLLETKKGAKKARA